MPEQRHRRRRAAPATFPATIVLSSVVVPLGTASRRRGGVAADRAVGQRGCHCGATPPPRAGVAADGAVGQRERAAVLYRPPPPLPDSAELPLTVQSVSVAVPELHRPPPLPAELPLTVQLVSVVVPSLYRPPPLPLTACRR